MSGGFANAVYYPSWIIYKGKPPSWLNVTQASHVLYSFVGYSPRLFHLVMLRMLTGSTASMKMEACEYVDPSCSTGAANTMTG